MENPIKMDDLGVPLFLETPLYDQPDYKIMKIQQHFSAGIFFQSTKFWIFQMSWSCVNFSVIFWT